MRESQVVAHLARHGVKKTTNEFSLGVSSQPSFPAFLEWPASSPPHSTDPLRLNVFLSSLICPHLCFLESLLFTL